MLADYSLLIACLSLVISLWSWRLNEISFKRNAENDHTSMMLKIDEHLISHPDLWSIYDSHPLSNARYKHPDPLAQAKREAFIYMHFNVFDLVFAFYHSGAKMNKRDRMTWQAWEQYINQFLKKSTEARELLKQQRTQDIYPHDFTAFMNKSMGSAQETTSQSKLP